MDKLLTLSDNEKNNRIILTLFMAQDCCENHETWCGEVLYKSEVTCMYIH